MNEALPCPMCGNPPRVVDLGGWEVICDCGVDYCSHTDPSKEAALAGWNRRAHRAEQVPTGWVTVPMKPTEAMLRSIAEAVSDTEDWTTVESNTEDRRAAEVYRAMLAAIERTGPHSKP